MIPQLLEQVFYTWRFIHGFWRNFFIGTIITFLNIIYIVEFYFYNVFKTSILSY